MAYPFPSQHSTHSSQYLVVPPPRPRSTSRHHRSHSHSGHHDHAGYPPNVVYTTHNDYQYPPAHRHPSHSSHHSSHHQPSHSSHHLPHYSHSTHSHQSHSRPRSRSHSRSYAPTYPHTRERAPSISDRIRGFFGLDPSSDHYPHHHHQPHHQPHHYTHSDDRRRRHNSFSSFRDDSRPQRNNSVRSGPWFFGAVDNRRYLDEHGREVDHHGRVIHRM